MAMEHYFQEAAVWNDSDEDEISLKKWESVDNTVDESKNNPPSGFDCNICLDVVQDPVVTLCGHLYCWPCIYKWMNVRSVSPENPDQQQPQCPVCKAEVSQMTLIPLYGRGQDAKSSEGKGTHLGIIVPQRPSSASGRIHTPVMSATAHSFDPAQQFRRYRSHPQQPRSYHARPTLELAGMTTDSLNPMSGMFGEMVYARIFGNSDSGLYAYPNSYRLAGSNSPRVRRHIMQADQSLGRICFFLCCCTVLCLLLF